MSRIYGEAETISRAKAAKAGDKSVYINWDAIRELPEQYEIVVTEIKFNPQNLAADFSDVGNSTYMPQPHLMYKIAEACGISGGDKSISEPLIEEVDINPMLMKGMEDVPTYRRMTVGRKVVKYATRLQEDGTLFRSGQCTCEYNVWERCAESWSTEEFYTEGYSKAGKYPPKYDNRYKRKKHFDSEMKFAHAKAETKAHLKAIREVAGLMTGYKSADLQNGSLIFARVRRSREALQMETAAHLQAISRGGVTDTVQALFGPESHDEPDTPADVEPFPGRAAEPVQPEPEPEPRKSPREVLIAVLKNYLNEQMIVPDQIDAVESAVKWLEGNQQAEQDTTYWPRAIDMLKTVEAKIPEEGKITHGLV